MLDDAFLPNGSFPEARSEKQSASANGLAKKNEHNVALSLLARRERRILSKLFC